MSKQLKQRFEKTCQRLGFNRQRVTLDVTQFEPGLLRGQGTISRFGAGGTQ